LKKTPAEPFKEERKNKNLQIWVLKFNILPAAAATFKETIKSHQKNFFERQEITFNFVF
jgi:hypothetical protein